MKQTLTIGHLASDNPSEVQIDRILRYELFQSACRILEAGCRDRKLSGGSVQLWKRNWATIY